MNSDNWPPDYVSMFQWRITQLNVIRNDHIFLRGAIEYYRNNPVDFITHWCDTVDPRNAGKSDHIVRMPFILFERQRQLIRFLEDCRNNEENGLVEKCRDAGLTWACSAYSVWLWRFVPGTAVGWGSRKEQLVDKLGVMDSIFEKIRSIIRNMPREFWPYGFDPSKHMTYMRIINPDNDSAIIGEAGDNIGRGGRTTIYFKDESAHYEHPESIEAALSENTRVQIDISSVNGLGNVFHRRREQGVEWAEGVTLPPNKTRVFIFDWSDHPGKTIEWYEAKKAKFELDGLGHIFAQEVDRNYSASVEGVIISDEWVRAAIDAHIKLGIDINTGNHIAALDVADGGHDVNAYVRRRGILLNYADQWGASDTGETARRAVRLSTMTELLNLQYDAIGVGSGVKAEFNRLKNETLLPKNIIFFPWLASGKVKKPFARIIEDDTETPKNVDFFKNLKAQAWWSLAMRFHRTWQAVTQGISHDPEELISISSDISNIGQLRKELTQVTRSFDSSGKMIINKTPDGTRSPNLADAAVMCYFPVGNEYAQPVFGVTSGS